MKISRKHFLAVGPLALALAGAVPCAADKIDLDRDTPVPANQPIPVQDFFRAPIFREPVVNPSGTRIAAIVSSGIDHSAMMVYDLATKQIESLGAKGDSDVNWVNWLGDDRVIFQITIQKLGGFIFGGAKVGALQSAYPILQNFNGQLVAIPPNDRLHPLVNLGPHMFATGRYGQVMTVNGGIDSGKMIDLSGNGALLGEKNLDDAAEDNVKHVTTRYPVLETPDGFQLYYMADKDGKLEFGVTSTDGLLTLHRLDVDHWERCPEDLDEMQVAGSGDNPGEVVVLGPRASNQPRPLEVLDAATGVVKEILVQDKAYDGFGWPYRDPVSHNIVGVHHQRTGPHFIWFSEAYRNLQKMVDGLFPGQIVEIIGNDEKGKVVLIKTFSDRQPDFFHWVNLETHSVGDIRQSQPWIDPKRMQPMSAIKYRTRDGKSLDAYIVMPAGATKQNPPALVVIPPDGPWSRHTWGYNSQAQFLASRGYAVLLPNHRGSEGTTWMFPTEDEWAYGKMHEDVTEATKTVVASGLVDPKRVAIMGTEFGGFLSLSGAAYDPSIYRCAVAVSAVTDWGKFVADYRYNKFTSSYYSRMVRKLGDPDRDPAKWDAIAPLRHAGEIRAAVFVATGEYDSPLVITGSKQVASIVDRNHIPTETASFINEADGVRHLRNQVDLYERIEAFLAKNL